MAEGTTEVTHNHTDVESNVSPIEEADRIFSNVGLTYDDVKGKKIH